ncbi:MAG: hypothetical protein JJ714_00035 [Acidithiobacillus sp.]|nr:hypothetical protein [Acidithiobacillus sp.]
MADLVNGQTQDGGYRASRFEQNPGRLGTPHEAAASAGLLGVIHCLEPSEQVAALNTTRRNLDQLILRLLDEERLGFNDSPGVRGRVPNKLATFADALLQYGSLTDDERYLNYARLALADVLRFQERSGPFRGAIHQYAEGGTAGDGRFFPYYNARCVGPLWRAYRVLGEKSYGEAAKEIMRFLSRVRNTDGTWPQIIYKGGPRAEYPHWIAGSADILNAYLLMGEKLPEGSLDWILDGQLPSGGFRTADGFPWGERKEIPDVRNVIPVVGWNDKVLRMLAEILPEGQQIPCLRVQGAALTVSIGRMQARYVEDPVQMRITAARGIELYQWNKQDPWAAVASYPEFNP